MLSFGRQRYARNNGFIYSKDKFDKSSSQVAVDWYCSFADKKVIPLFERAR